MRVLVTGAAGSIGQVATVGLAALGHDVVGLDLVPASHGHAAQWYVADCTDPDAVHAVLEDAPVEAVIHLAGNPGE